MAARYTRALSGESAVEQLREVGINRGRIICTKVVFNGCLINKTNEKEPKWIGYSSRLTGDFHHSIS